MNENNKDALNNLIHSIQEKMGNNAENSDEATSNISSLLNTLNSSNTSSQDNSQDHSKESTDESSNSNPFGSIDPSIFLKIQQIMSALNSKSPQKDFLISLKPFLRKSRQDKIGEYMSMLTIAKAIEIFTSKGSDDNVWK